MNNYFLLFLVCTHVGFLSIAKDPKNEPLSLILGPEGYHFPSGHESPDESSLQLLCPVEMDKEEPYNEYILGPKVNEGPFCEKPVKALLRKSKQLSVSCGIDGKSVYYDFVYRILKKNGVGWEAKFIELLIYRICFDYKNQKTLYTYHPMISPAIFESQSYIKKSQKTFTMDRDNYNFLLQENDLKYLHNEYTKYSKPGLKILALNKLKPLLLVSPKDMPFPLLKNPTHHYINSVPAWTNVIEMWDVINDYLRTIAINIDTKFLDVEEQKMIQMSGWMGHLELNERKMYLDDSKKIAIPEFIWKLAYIGKEQKIAAILLRNIPSSGKDNKSVDRRCMNINYNGVQELKERRPKIDWNAFIQFCDRSVITDLFQIPANLGFLLRKEYLLPLVLIYNSELDEYQLPQEYTGLEKSRTNGERPTQTLFCPYQNKSNTLNENQCLVFNQNKDPYCRQPLEPFNRLSESPKMYCNNGSRSYLYDRIYEMCSVDKQIEYQEEFGNKESETSPKFFKLEVYSICMDNGSRHVASFTYHVIRSTELLGNKYLKKEREISYESYHYPPTQIPRRVMFENVHYPYALRGIYDPYLLLYSFNRLYLVPPEDMAYPLLRKATYQIGNMTYAWENIITVYNIIHERLRLHAIHKNQELIEINGVEDVLKLESKTVFADQYPLPKYIWTVVYNPDKTENIAIVINNIPHKNYSGEVEKLCETSTCRIQEWDITMGTDLATFAYCCDAEVITNIHYFPKADGKLEIEALYWPLVLIQYNERYFYPENFMGFDELADDPEFEQINFCPAENVDESGLLPNMSSIPYCTKPVKYVWKIIEHSDICFGRDMVDVSVRFQLSSEGSTITEFLEVYRVCYHIKNKRTRFTYHELISPAVMNNRELDIQRSKKFSWDTNDYGLLNNDFKISENAFEKRNSGIFQEIAKQSLERLMLTSPYQMPFASLIEPTYHYVNVIPAWEEIVHIWNAIDDHILKMALKKKQIFKHINGSSKDVLQTIDGEKIYLDDDKQIPMSKYIWKVVYDEYMKQNVAIIIHNSPQPDKLCDPKTNLCRILRNKISQPDKLCEPNTNLCSFLKRNEHFRHGSLSSIAYCCQGDVITEMHNLYKSSSSLIVGEIQYYWKHTDGN